MRWIAQLFLLLCLVTLPSRALAQANNAPNTQNPNFPKQGLCIYIGAGKGTLLTEMASHTELLIHGLAVDATQLAAAQQQIAAANLPGRVVVEKIPLNPLPYVRDLANIVILDDLDTLTANGLTMAEAQRVLVPNGTMFINQGGVWTSVSKPRPAEMDQWTHPMHGPDGNLVSTDKVIQFPLGLRFLDGLPLNFTNAYAACRAIVSANGRTFSITTTEYENLPPWAMKPAGRQTYLTARDAYNGLPLWKINCEIAKNNGALNYRNLMPLVTDGQYVYFYKKDALVAAAATGQITASYPVKYRTIRLLLADGVLVSCAWEGVEANAWEPWIVKTENGAVEAFDVANGQKKWTIDVPAEDMVESAGMVYLLLQGRPVAISAASTKPATSTQPTTRRIGPTQPSMQRIVAVDLHNGHELWSRPHTEFSAKTDLQILEAGQGTLVVAGNKSRTITILNAADGKTLWEIKKAVDLWAPIVGGELWHGVTKYDLKTGKVVGELPSAPRSGACTTSNLTNTILSDGREGLLFDLAHGDGAKQASVFAMRGARGGCVENYIPANGMYYAAQNYCICSPGQVPGFVGFGPCGALPEPAAFAAARTVEKGPAFGTPNARQGNHPLYCIFGGNEQRSAAFPGKLAAAYKLAWQTPATVAPAGPLAQVWAARLRPFLSSPTATTDLVFVALPEANQIRAFRTQTGERVWTFTASGRIDSPPTATEDYIYFGAHDGYVYALRAQDGALAWRCRLAPLERRMVAFGQIESVWPALGSVLLQDGTLYATAGRSTEADGGVAVAALNPLTGQTLWSSVLAPGPKRQNDILRFANGALVFHEVRLDPKTGAVMAAPKNATADFASGLEGLLDSTWMRMGNRRSGNHAFGKLNAELWAWNDVIACGSDQLGRSCFAISRARINQLEKTLPAKNATVPPDAYAWRTAMPTDRQITSMILTDSGLLIAGRILKKPTPNTTAPTAPREPFGGFCQLLSVESGKLIAELPLPDGAVPTYEALAITPERIFISCADGQLACLVPAVNP